MDVMDRAYNRTTGHRRLIYLLLHIAFEHLAADDGAEYVAFVVDTNALGAGVIGCGGFGIFDESLHAAIAGAANPDALFYSCEFMRSGVGSRFRVRDIDRVVFCDENAAGAAELVPDLEQFSTLVEDLNAVVFAVTDKQPSAGVH